MGGVMSVSFIMMIRKILNYIGLILRCKIMGRMIGIVLIIIDRVFKK